MKQALGKQGLYREQENSHLGWPDHTLVNYEGYCEDYLLVR